MGDLKHHPDTLRANGWVRQEELFAVEQKARELQAEVEQWKKYAEHERATRINCATNEKGWRDQAERIREDAEKLADWCAVAAPLANPEIREIIDRFRSKDSGE